MTDNRNLHELPYPKPDEQSVPWRVYERDRREDADERHQRERDVDDKIEKVRADLGQQFETLSGKFDNVNRLLTGILVTLVVALAMLVIDLARYGIGQ